MSRKLLCSVTWAALAFAWPAVASPWPDLYATNSLIPATPAAPLLRNASCQPVEADRPLELQDAVLQAICANAQASHAWADARAQAAAVGLGKAAYLPSLTATAGYERDGLSTTYDASAFGGGSVRQSQNSSSQYGILNLSWVLFDFGKRNAALRQARELLAAANATQDDVLQTVFFSAAQAYYAVRDAQASLDAARKMEDITKESLAEASARHAAGAGTLSDQLQAQTTWRHALLERVIAERNVRTAAGALAVAMGMAANTPIQIAASEPVMDHGQFAQGVDQLISDAQARQPKLAAARARVAAAQANVDAMRALGRPTVSLVGSLAQNNPSYQQQPQSVPISASRGSTIGIQVTIPLFEGFASGYRVAQAQAQADEQEADLQNARLQVSLDVWTSFQSLQADSENLDNSAALLDDAQHALEIARGRYKAGVGTFTELLSAQTALADAQKQRMLAVSEWRTARLKLAASLGNLGLWTEQ